MPTLIQHRQEFHLWQFLKCLTTDGPYVSIKTPVGRFPDVESAQKKAQEMMDKDPRLDFRVEMGDGSLIHWIVDSKNWHAREKAHERLGQWMQCIVLLLLSWLAVGWLNDGFFTRGTVILTAVMGFFLAGGSMIQNRCENLVLWIIVLTLALLAIPTFRQIQKARAKVERQRAAERATAVPDRPPSASR